MDVRPAGAGREFHDDDDQTWDVRVFLRGSPIHAGEGDRNEVKLGEPPTGGAHHRIPPCWRDARSVRKNFGDPQTGNQEGACRSADAGRALRHASMRLHTPRSPDQRVYCRSEAVLGTQLLQQAAERTANQARKQRQENSDDWSDLGGKRVRQEALLPEIILKPRHRRTGGGLDLIHAKF